LAESFLTGRQLAILATLVSHGILRYAVIGDFTRDVPGLGWDGHEVMKRAGGPPWAAKLLRDPHVNDAGDRT
jgi:hypothetical protein